MGFYQMLEQTGLGTFVRENPSLWGWPAFLTMHTIGMSLLVGMNAAVDLRILGVAPQMPLAPMARLFPFMWFGFALNALTGTGLFISEATKKGTSVVFLAKLILVALAVVVLVLIRRRVFRNSAAPGQVLPAAVKLLAVASIVCWLGAIVTGRLMAYLPY